VTNSRSILTTVAAFIAVLLVGAGCKVHRRAGIFTQDPQPSMAGQWSGTLNTASSTSTLVMTVVQDTMNINGTYTAPAGQPLAFGVSGTVEGVTTGHSFLVTLTPDDALCKSQLQIGGTNDGTEMDFSFSGVDCSSVSFTGQGYFNKQH
jgi:hypothetical protein